jgi:MerR family transcriptional regulator/heat shock protein HspR
MNEFDRDAMAPQPDAQVNGHAADAPLHDADAPMYVISVAAELAGMHPQTLRSYDRLGLVTPGRAAGRGRRYSARDVRLLRQVQRLSQDEGVNLEGIRRILALQDQVTALQHRLQELQADLEAGRREAQRLVADAHRAHRRDLVPVERATDVVLWRRR